jgi:hypothetical protein
MLPRRNTVVSWGFLLRSWTDTVVNAATEAANKPVYDFPVDVLSSSCTGAKVRTHEENDPLSILLPAFGHLTVLIFRNF